MYSVTNKRFPMSPRALSSNMTSLEAKFLKAILQNFFSRLMTWCRCCFAQRLQQCAIFGCSHIIIQETHSISSSQMYVQELKYTFKLGTWSTFLTGLLESLLLKENFFPLSIQGFADTFPYVLSETTELRHKLCFWSQK